MSNGKNLGGEMLRHLFYCKKCNLNFFGEDVQLKCPKCKQLIVAKSCCNVQNYTKQKELIVEIENKIDVRE